jgi:hypothetical protein
MHCPRTPDLSAPFGFTFGVGQLGTRWQDGKCRVRTPVRTDSMPQRVAPEWNDSETGSVMGRTSIQVNRQHSIWRDRLAAYRVVIDGECMGQVWSDDSNEYVVSPGDHTVRLTADLWPKVFTSGARTVRLASGDTATFTCKANGPAIVAVLALLWPRRSIHLSEPRIARSSDAFAGELLPPTGS